ncbi:hypothetical protein Btru_024139 [Bulinus truncatus]|nr:hypothetical protein Btru_024139 [Bulinus truncatus]
MANRKTDKKTTKKKKLLYDFNYDSDEEIIVGTSVKTEGKIFSENRSINYQEFEFSKFTESKKVSINDNEIIKEKASPIISATESNSFVEVADVSLQTSLNFSKILNVSDEFKDVFVNTLAHSVQNESDNDFSGTAESLLADKVCSNTIATNHCSDATHISDSSSQFGSFVAMADSSVQTSLDCDSMLVNPYKSVEQESSISKQSDSLNDMTNLYTTAVEFLPAYDSNDSLNYSDREASELKEVNKNAILAFDSDEEFTEGEHFLQASPKVVNESDNEDVTKSSDNSDTDINLNDSFENNQDECNVDTSDFSAEISNIVGKLGAMSVISSKQRDSSSSEDEFENFLKKVKQPEMKAKKLENSRMPVKDFIVDDSDVSDDSDEVFHIKLNNDLDEKENKNRYCFDRDKLRSFLEDELSKDEKFLVTNYTPRTARKDWLRRTELEIPPLKKELTMKQSLSNKDVDQNIAEDYSHFLHSLSNEYPDFKRHPKAARFIKFFKEIKLELSRYLHQIFNETVFENKVSTPRQQAPFSYKSTPNNFTAKITLSVKVCDSPERLRDILAHELCHAAVKLINGVNEGHGVIWKSWAKRFNRKYSFMPVIVRHEYVIKQSILTSVQSVITEYIAIPNLWILMLKYVGIVEANLKYF